MQYHNTFYLFVEMLSEAVKMLKGEYTIRAIRQMKMDRAIIFCRTKLDCDNMENYLNKHGGGTALIFFKSLHQLLHDVKSKNDLPMAGSIIYHSVSLLAGRGNHEFSCVCLHGDRKPQERKGNLEKFKASSILVTFFFQLIK